MDTWIAVMGLVVTVSLAAAGGILKLYAYAHPRRTLRDIGEASEVLGTLAPGSPEQAAVNGYLEHQVFLLERSNSRRQAPLAATSSTRKTQLSRALLAVGTIVIANGITFGVLLWTVPLTREFSTAEFVVIGLAVTGLAAIVVDGYSSVQSLRGGARWRSFD